MKWYLISILFAPLAVQGQLKLANIFSDNMVLQRQERLPVWGRGVPGERVSVVFGNERKTSFVRKDSSWSLYLEKQKANPKGQSLFISSGIEKIELANILIGDVWIAAGQSNMEWPMIREMHWKEEMTSTDQPLIRLNNPPPVGRYVYGVAYTDSLTRRLTQDSFYLWDGWKTCNSQTVKDMSAVAYYFAKCIVDSEKVPIGLIHLSIGGAPIETFISREAFRHRKKFAAKLEGSWLENEHLPKWVRQRGKENVGNIINDNRDGSGPNHAYKPGFAYQGGIGRLMPLPIKGIIWYQGESNALERERVEEYGELFQLMVSDYREKWKNPDLPFYWVQLSSIDTANYQSQYWPRFRDEQRRLLDVMKHGGMAVSSDAGLMNDVHPRNKKLVGERLARWALNKTYKKNVVPSGPLPIKARYREGKIIVDFTYANGLGTSDKKPLRGFSVDSKTEVEAHIQNTQVVIMSKKKPGFIYYGWKPYTDANLVNGEMLPASTFCIQVE